MKISLNLSPVFIKIILTTICCLITKSWTKSCVKEIHLPSGAEYMFYTESIPKMRLDGADCFWNVTTEQHHEIIMSCDPEEYKENVKSAVYLYISKTDNMKDASIYEPPFTENAAKLYITKNSTGIKPEDYFCKIKSEPSANPQESTNCDCGYVPMPEKGFGNRIVRLEEFPSMVFIWEINFGRINCDGTIIAATVVLTAAHCLRWNPDIKNYMVVVGAQCISQGLASTACIKYELINKIVYNESVTQVEVNDIALLITETPIIYSKYATPACLPFNLPKEAIIGANVIVPVWFSTSKSMTDILRVATLKVLPDELCAQNYGGYDNQTHICTDGHGLMNTCLSDSGGPIYLIHEERYYVVGVVSYGMICDGKTPNKDVNVNNYGSWIKDSMPEITFCEV